MKTIEERVKEIIVTQLCVDDEEVIPSAKLMDDLGGDSLDIVEMVMIVEEEFDLDIPDACAEKFETVKDVVDYLTEKVK